MLSDGYSSAGDIWGAEKKSVVLAGSLVTAQNKLLPHLEACHVQAIHNDASRSIKAYAWVQRSKARILPRGRPSVR